MSVQYWERRIPWLLLAAVCMVFGFWAGATGWGAPKPKPEVEQRSDWVVCKGLCVIDDDGRPRVTITVPPAMEGGCKLDMIDRKGNTSVQIVQFASGQGQLRIRPIEPDTPDIVMPTWK